MCTHRYVRPLGYNFFIPLCGFWRSSLVIAYQQLVPLPAESSGQPRSQFLSSSYYRYIKPLWVFKTNKI